MSEWNLDHANKRQASQDPLSMKDVRNQDSHSHRCLLLVSKPYGILDYVPIRTLFQMRNLSNWGSKKTIKKVYRWIKLCLQLSRAISTENTIHQHLITTGTFGTIFFFLLNRHNKCEENNFHFFVNLCYRKKNSVQNVINQITNLMVRKNHWSMCRRMIRVSSGIITNIKCQATIWTPQRRTKIWR